MEGIERLAAALQGAGIPLLREEPLARHTSFCIGGPAAVFCTPEDMAGVARAIALAKECGVPWYLLGKGTNVLFCDEGYSGMVLKLPEGAVTVEDGRIVAGAGCKLEAVCTAARDAGLAGLEFAYGIPGSIGGAVYMNAGAFGGEMKAVLRSVTLLDEGQRIVELPVEALELGYRDSIFHRRDWCILSAELTLAPGEPEDITAAMEANMAHRQAKQPLDMPSAGSAFKRPEGAFAGALIDQCGLRGHRVGGAAISEKHCGFIVNLGGASCADVLALADEVAAIVKARTGYVLEKEIRVVPPPSGSI